MLRKLKHHEEKLLKFVFSVFFLFSLSFHIFVLFLGKLISLTGRKREILEKAVLLENLVSMIVTSITSIERLLARFNSLLSSFQE